LKRFLNMATVLGILVGFVAGWWFGTERVQRRMDPLATYGNVLADLQLAQDALAESIEAGSEEALVEGLIKASYELDHARQQAYILETQLRTAYGDTYSLFPHRIGSLQQASRDLVEAELQDGGITAEELEILRAAVERLLAELPDTDETDLMRLRSKLHELEAPSVIHFGSSAE